MRPKAKNGERALGDAPSRVKVLLVDDDDDARAQMAEFLEMCGTEAIAAESGDEAFARFRATRPDVVISDIHMPGNDGLWLIRAIRALPEEDGGKTPAVAISAAAEPDDTLGAGFDRHLAKPLDASRLPDMIHELVRGATSAAKAASAEASETPRTDPHPTRAA